MKSQFLNIKIVSYSSVSISSITPLMKPLLTALLPSTKAECILSIL